MFIVGEVWVRDGWVGGRFSIVGWVIICYQVNNNVISVGDEGELGIYYF